MWILIQVESVSLHTKCNLIWIKHLVFKSEILPQVHNAIRWHRVKTLSCKNRIWSMQILYEFIVLRSSQLLVGNPCQKNGRDWPFWAHWLQHLRYGMTLPSICCGLIPSSWSSSLAIWEIGLPYKTEWFITWYKTISLLSRVDNYLIIQKELL